MTLSVVHRWCTFISATTKPVRLVLRLGARGPRAASVFGLVLPVGHIYSAPGNYFLRSAQDGTFYGVTVLDAQHMIDEHGELTVTLPVPESVELPGGDLQFA